MVSQALPAASRRRRRLGGYVTAIAVTGLLLVVLFPLIRWGAFYVAYAWLLEHVIELTGQDIWISRAVALGILTFFWFAGWRILLFPWVGDGRKRAALLLAATVLGLAAMERVTRDVYFSRADGEPLKFYIRTLDGYKFSESPGTDPVYGVRYWPVTAESAKEYLLWKKRGGKMQDPALPEDQYFSTADGEPLRWYAELPDGRIEMFTLPGFHPRTGQKLLAATPEVAKRLEKQKAGEEAKRRQEELARQEAREEARRRSREAAERSRLRPGRYVFAEPYPSGVLDDYRFTLSEVHLTAGSTYLHLTVARIPPPSPWSPSPRYEGLNYSGIVLRLLLEDGRELAEMGFDFTQDAYRDGGLALPSGGRSSRSVRRFPALPGPARTFTLVANDYLLIGSIDLQRAEFQAF